MPTRPSDGWAFLYVSRETREKALAFCGEYAILGRETANAPVKMRGKRKDGNVLGKIIAVFNQKGGVGKTTTAVNLAAAVAAEGKRCLLVDLDPQGNATSGVGLDRRQVTASTYELLIGTAQPRDAVMRTAFQNLEVIPCSTRLAGAEIELVEQNRRESRLKAALAALRDAYDFLFIDCPPSLGLLSLNALCAADTFLVPLQCEYYALDGMAQLMATVRQVKRLYNPPLDIEGVVLTMYDGRLNLTQQVVAEVKRFFPRKVFATAIPRSVRLSEAPSFGQPIHYYDRGSKGARAYDELARELIEKNRGGAY